MTKIDQLPSIYSRVAERIGDWNPIDAPVRWNDEAFDNLAGRLFRYQFAENEAYRDFCKRRGVGPDTLDGYRDIPAVATEVFKGLGLTCGGSVRRTFRTSGTTTGDRGAHHFRTLEVYRRSLHPPFRRFCHPDGGDLRLLVMAPSPDQMPDSSLSYMLGEFVDRWGDEASGFGTRVEDGEVTFDFESFAESLREAEREQAPTVVFGTAFGLAEFFSQTDERWSLSDDSRVVETGGFKGRTDELSKSKLYEWFDERLGIPKRRCLSEYSMTELSSQAYTAPLRSGNEAALAPEDRGFYPPPWARIEIVDLDTLEVCDEPDQTGLIRWYDLANVGSVCAVQTSDLGYRNSHGGIVLKGRATDAPLRGCSLTAEEIADTR